MIASHYGWTRTIGKRHLIVRGRHPTRALCGAMVTTAFDVWPDARPYPDECSRCIAQEALLEADEAMAERLRR